MFDLSVGKLLLIATVALIVIGPEQLPKVAKTIGIIAARLRRYIAGVKMELQQALEKTEFSQLEATLHTTSSEIKQMRQEQPIAVEPTPTVAGRKPTRTAKNVRQAPSAATPSTQPVKPATIRPSPARKQSANVSSAAVPTTHAEQQLTLFDDPPAHSRTAHRDRR